MSTLLIPAAIVVAPDHVPHSPFHDWVGLCRADMKAWRDRPAAERRQLIEQFVELFQWDALPSMLPLQ